MYLRVTVELFKSYYALKCFNFYGVKLADCILFILHYFYALTLFKERENILKKKLPFLIFIFIIFTFRTHTMYGKYCNREKIRL